jgi:NADH-quinone oxidoreductase subunit M
LAGVLLKLGIYGFARFSIPMLPQATAACLPWIMWLSAIGIVYGALVALVQTDMKRLIAYSSVSHLGFCMLGLFALNTLSVQGSVLQMINHGLSTGGLFAVVGMIYDRYHTREISKLGGLARRTPVLAFFMLLFTFSSIGLPGLNGFAGEFPILQGTFSRAWNAAPAAIQDHLKAVAVLSVSGVVLGAWYMLWLVERIFFGPLREPDTAHAGADSAPHGHAPVSDLSPREVLALVPLAVFVFWIGLHPAFFLKRMAPDVDAITLTASSKFEEMYQTRVPAVAQTAGSSDQPAPAEIDEIAHATTTTSMDNEPQAAQSSPRAQSSPAAQTAEVAHAR